MYLKELEKHIALDDNIKQYEEEIRAITKKREQAKKALHDAIKEDKGHDIDSIVFIPNSGHFVIKSISLDVWDGWGYFDSDIKQNHREHCLSAGVAKLVKRGKLFSLLTKRKSKGTIEPYEVVGRVTFDNQFEFWNDEYLEDDEKLTSNFKKVEK